MHGYEAKTAPVLFFVQIALFRVIFRQMGGKNDMSERRIINLNGGKHRSKADVARRQYEETLVNKDCEDLDNVKASQFVSAAAKREYGRALKRLRESGGTVCNLNLSDLIAYANSYARYMDLAKQCRKKTFAYVVETANGPRPNPIVRMMDEARRDMAESSRRLGMTLEGQLKTAKAKADKQEAEMEKKFGAI